MTRWTERDLERHIAGARGVEPTKPKKDPALRRMNKTEAEYAHLLELKRRAGEIRSWGFERIKLRLADATFYTPDFDVIGIGGELAFHEVKGGFVREDAWLKFKIARELHKWAAFKLFQKVGGEWVMKA